jgi:A/G-specific adenine glycosylase
MTGSLDRAALLAWAAGRRDDLPWRHTRDPWAVLLSELMLQQTQVARVVPRWHRFLVLFPNARACADAGVGAVVTEWAGLGYNRRAVSLHRAAVAIVERHRGEVPDDLAQLLDLPGVGPYTARAVMVFAFERDDAVVDTNVGRVLARQVGSRLAARSAQDAADDLVPIGRGWAWNQAILDLGAILCTKRSPSCDECPVSGSCAWFASGRSEPDPADGSAGVSGRQSRFEGSFRQGRARLLDVLRLGEPVPQERWLVACGWESREDGVADVERAADSLVSDGLALQRPDGSLSLP